jgi:hypothetical protein
LFFELLFKKINEFKNYKEVKMYRSIFTIGVLALSLPVLAEKQVIVDLAVSHNNTKLLSEFNETDIVFLKNAVPTHQYSFTHTIDRVAIQPPAALRANTITALKQEKPPKVADTSQTANGVVVDADGKKGKPENIVPSYTQDQLIELVWDQLRHINANTKLCADLVQNTLVLNSASSPGAVRTLIYPLEQAISSYIANVVPLSQMELQVRHFVDSLINLPADQQKKNITLIQLGHTFSDQYCTTALANAKTEISKTEIQIGVTIKPHYTTTLKVIYDADPGDNKVNSEWSLIYEGEAEGKFLTTISYLFATDINDTYYFTEKTNLTDTSVDHYAVYESQTNTDGYYIPSVMATYIPNYKWNDGFNWSSAKLGYSFGLALDNSKPGLIAGISGVWGDNIVLTIGAGMFADKELSGNYTPYKVGESLTEVKVIPDPNDSTKNIDITVLKEGIRTLPQATDEAGLMRDVYSSSLFISLGFAFEL